MLSFAIPRHKALIRVQDGTLMQESPAYQQVLIGLVTEDVP
jgi:hypothetical protein